MKYKVITVLISVSLLIVLLLLQRHRNTNINSVTLTPNQKEKLIFNPDKHTLSIITKDNTKTVYIGDHTGAVTINKDGNVIVIAPQWGFEHKIFVGLGYNGDVNCVGGISIFYYKRFDVNVGLALSHVTPPVHVFLAPSYNIYHNTHLYLGVDERRVPIGGLIVRF